MKIVAIDDEKLALKVLTNAVSEAMPEADITTFLDVEDALAYISKNDVETIFCDYKMPKLNGIEFAAKVKAIRDNIKIIFVTGYSEYAMDAINTVSPEGYIIKPVSSEKIKSIMHNFVKTSYDMLEVRTFGNFDVFYKGNALIFTNKKAKELFAYLVHRNGSTCTRKELTALLYEDAMEENASRYFTDCLKNISELLASIHMGKVLIHKFNSYALDINYYHSDYMDYLGGNHSLFEGEYMVQYSWGEERTAALAKEIK